MAAQEGLDHGGNRHPPDGKADIKGVIARHGGRLFQCGSQPKIPLMLRLRDGLEVIRRIRARWRYLEQIGLQRALDHPRDHARIAASGEIGDQDTAVGLSRLRAGDGLPQGKVHQRQARQRRQQLPSSGIMVI
ncbi:hypothetical protein D3C75_476830 [compost metagenome]